MKQHLICLDLDGTLLNDEKEIPEYTFRVLKHYNNKGMPSSLQQAALIVQVNVTTTSLDWIRLSLTLMAHLFITLMMRHSQFNTIV